MIFLLSIDPNTNTERDNYKLLIGSIIPRPIAFVTSLSEDGVVNAAPFSYFNIVSSNPPMVSVSFQRQKGTLKDSAKNIKEQKEFVVHIVDENIVNQVNETAANLQPDESEIERTNLSTISSDKISVPGIEESKVRFECVLEHGVELGGDNEPGCDLLIGKIVQFHIAKDIYYDGKIDPRKLNAVSRLAGHDYATIGDIFTIKRPD